MKKITIAFGELWLKSETVRRMFINRLANNIKLMLKEELEWFKLEKRRDFILIETEEIERAVDVLKRVFGISNFSVTEEIDTEIKNIEKTVLELSKSIKRDETFAVRVKRKWKDFPIKSKELESLLGSRIKRSVDLKNPDRTISVQIDEKKSYVWMSKTKGLGGLPFGVSGKGLFLMSGGIDSPVASWLMMKRGMAPDFIHFYNSSNGRQSKKTAIELVKRLREYSPRGLNLFIVPYTEIQKKIADKGKFVCVFCKRIMYKISEMVAEKTGSKALITGESLGQVASQTVDNLLSENYGINMPLFRPLIGFDKSEIIEIAKRIGTYGISIKLSLHCNIAPKKPTAKAKLADILKEEESIRDIDILISKAIKDMIKIEIN